MESRKFKPDDPEQSRRFIRDAKRLGCDQGEGALDRLLRAIRRPKGKKS